MEYGAELGQLHLAAGRPSARKIEAHLKGAGQKVSRSTVNDTLSGRTLPSWPVLALIVKALNGDTAQFQRLWIAARDERLDSQAAPDVPPLETDSINQTILRELTTIRELLEQLIETVGAPR
jgi:hypothetical protein